MTILESLVVLRSFQTIETIHSLQSPAREDEDITSSHQLDVCVEASLKRLDQNKSTMNPWPEMNGALRGVGGPIRTVIRMSLASARCQPVCSQRGHPWRLGNTVSRCLPSVL